MEKKLRKRGRWYVMYDTKNDGELVFEGRLRDAVLFFNVKATTLKNAFDKGYLLKGRYLMEAKDISTNEFKTWKPKKDSQIIKEKKEVVDIFYNDYNYMLHHLKTYGNTIFPTDPSKILKQIKKKEGINTKVTFYKGEKTIDDVLGSSVSGSSLPDIYLIERI